MGSVRALINRSRWPGHRSDNNDDVNSPKNCETPKLSRGGGGYQLSHVAAFSYQTTADSDGGREVSLSV